MLEHVWVFSCIFHPKYLSCQGPSSLFSLEFFRAMGSETLLARAAWLGVQVIMCKTIKKHTFFEVDLYVESMTLNFE